MVHRVILVLSCFFLVVLFFVALCAAAIASALAGRLRIESDLWWRRRGLFLNLIVAGVFRNRSRHGIQGVFPSFFNFVLHCGSLRRMFSSLFSEFLYC